MTTQAHSRKELEHIQSSAAQTVPGSLSLPEHQGHSTSALTCPLSHVRLQPGSSVHWGQEKMTFQCKEKASAKLLPPTTLATAKHSKTKLNKYTGQAPVLQKEKKNNPRAEFQRQLHSSFSPEPRLPQHLTRSLAARRRGPHLSLSQPPPAWHRADQNSLS